MKKTIAEFKRRMKVGSKWIFTAHYLKESVERTCTIHQSNSFALTGIRNPKESSWCDWPKKEAVSIDFIDGKMAILIKIDVNIWIKYFEAGE